MKTNKRGPPGLSSQPVARVRPSIALSQNYLRNTEQVEALIRRSTICSEDVVIDIGAGTGTLTQLLMKRAGRVIAIEKDTRLASALRDQFGTGEAIEVIHTDILEFGLPTEPYKVFANIPYNLTAAIINKLTDNGNPPQDAYLVVQKEAAEKFMGQPKESMYALLLKPWYRLSILHHFEPTDFDPAPSIDSVMLRIHLRHKPLLAPSARGLYRDFVTYCFTHATPSLYATLQTLIGHRAFDAARSVLRIDASITPSALDFELWLSLFCQFAQHATPSARRLIANSEMRLRHEQSQLQKLHRTRPR